MSNEQIGNLIRADARLAEIILCLGDLRNRLPKTDFKDDVVILQQTEDNFIILSHKIQDQLSEYYKFRRTPK